MGAVVNDFRNNFWKMPLQYNGFPQSGFSCYIEATWIKGRVNGDFGLLTGKVNDLVVVHVKKNDIIMKEIFGDDFVKSIDTFTMKKSNGDLILFFRYNSEIGNQISKDCKLAVFSDHDYIQMTDSLITYNTPKVCTFKSMPGRLIDYFLYE